jgi:hypothetical protein
LLWSGWIFLATEVTRQCFEELVRRYQRYDLQRTPAHRIHSEAGLGKAYLKEMGVKAWRDVQKDFDPLMIGAIMSSYFGGHAEVHIRRTIAPTLHCDIASKPGKPRHQKPRHGAVGAKDSRESALVFAKKN